MARQEICILIDIRLADIDVGKDSDYSSHQRSMRYVALDKMGLVRLEKTYDSLRHKTP